MLQNDIRRADAVRHTSVDAGTRTANRADSHGYRPQNQADLAKHVQGTPSPRVAVPGLQWTPPWPFAVDE